MTPIPHAEFGGRQETLGHAPADIVFDVAQTLDLRSIPTIRATFVRACSRCHALPDPRQRAPEEWPAVVNRMRENMERMGVDGISDGEARGIIRYLQQAASGAAG